MKRQCGALVFLRKGIAPLLAVVALLLTGCSDSPLGTDPVTGEDEPPLTGDLSFMYTGLDSSETLFDLDAWSGHGTDSESWTISVFEKPLAYFAVGKSAAQTLSVGGGDRDRVARAPAGEVMDGSLAGNELEVFAVDLEDLLFEGGERVFTLTVTEEGRAAKTVTLRLKQEVEEVFALYIAGEDGSLTRLNSLNSEKFVDVSKLQKALEWIDAHGQSNTHYVMRLASDEAIHRSLISCPGRDNITITLRGLGKRRIYSEFTAETYNTGDSNSGDGLLNINKTSSVSSHITLILGKNIVFDGQNTPFPKGAKSMISVGANSRLVLQEGATITGFNCTGYVIDVRASGELTMEGGELSGNLVASSVIYLNGGRLIMRGGEISGNTTASELSGSGSGGSVFAVTLTGSARMEIYDPAKIINNPNLSGVSVRGVFVMEGGEISGNATDRNYYPLYRIARTGVYVLPGGSFTMRGGTIGGNGTGGPSSAFFVSGLNLASSGVAVTLDGPLNLSGNIFLSLFKNSSGSVYVPNIHIGTGFSNTRGITSLVLGLSESFTTAYAMDWLSRRLLTPEGGSLDPAAFIIGDTLYRYSAGVFEPVPGPSFGIKADGTVVLKQ
jgi:hypothetical protein